MICPRCGRENEPENQFCGRCGLEFAQVQPDRPDDGDVKYCYRHPREATRLSCGRCDRPICTKCVVIGPAGPRCPDCAKQNIPFNPRGAVHDVMSSVGKIGRMGPWSIYLWIVLAGMLFGLVRSCGSRREPDYRDVEPPPIESPAPKTSV